MDYRGGTYIYEESEYAREKEGMSKERKNKERKNKEKEKKRETLVEVSFIP